MKKPNGWITQETAAVVSKDSDQTAELILSLGWSGFLASGLVAEDTKHM